LEIFLNSIDVDIGERKNPDIFVGCWRLLLGLSNIIAVALKELLKALLEFFFLRFFSLSLFLVLSPRSALAL
jgi:hypothetical protein